MKRITRTLKDSKLACKKCGGLGLLFPNKDTRLIHTKNCDACGGSGCAPVVKAMYA